MAKKAPNIKQKQCCNEFSKDFKNGPPQEKKIFNTDILNKIYFIRIFKDTQNI